MLNYRTSSVSRPTDLPVIQVSTDPEPTRRPVDDGLPVLRLQTDNLSANPNGQPGSLSHSPSFKSNITIPKRKYSQTRHDSLEETEMPTFRPNEMKLRKKAPSSPATVLAMSGLFICGILLILSGTLVLLQHRERPFLVTGGIFFAMGCVMILICGVLQRKNVVKYVLDVNRDLYFLHISDSYMWKLMFEERRSELPIPASA
ncbi:Protein F23H12.3 a [Aphelenchoides avenae]|nr:Protein F23H12.3 a [Aphelenchus avenae]